MTDTEGNSFLMSTVKPVPAGTTPVQVPDFATGGSSKVNERRRNALRSWLPQLLAYIRRAGGSGLSVQQASKEMASVPGFKEELRNQRATMLQFAQLIMARRHPH